MTEEELLVLCENFKDDDEAFRKIVDAYIKLHPENTITLAHGMGTSKSFVNKCAEGISRPHSSYQKCATITFIKRRVRYALRIKNSRDEAKNG